MSQFQSQPSASLTRPRFAVDTTSGPTVGVQAPQINNPTTDGDQSMAQLSGAIRLLGNTVGDLGDRQARIDFRAEQTEAKREAAADKAQRAFDQAQRNAAAQEYQQQLPVLINGIKTGAIAPTEEDQGDPELFVNRVLAERTAGFGDPYVTEAKRVAAPAMLRTVFAKMESDKKAAIKTQSEGLFSRVATTENPEELDMIVDEARKQPGMEEHVDGVLAKALINAAKNGNEPMVDSLKTKLGTEEVGAQDYAERLLVTAKLRNESENRAGFVDYAASVELSVLKNQTTPGLAIAQIEDEAKRRGIDASTLKSQIGPLLENVNRQQNRINDLQFETAASKSITAARTTAIRAGGALAKANFEPIEITLPSGAKKTIPAEEQRDSVISSLRSYTVGDLQKTMASADAESDVAVRDYVSQLSNSGIIDPDLQRMFKTIDTTEANLGVATPGDVQSVNAYLRVHAIDSTYAMSVIGNDDTGRMLRRASANIQLAGMSPQSAIIAAKLSTFAPKARQVDLGAASAALATADPTLSGQLQATLAPIVQDYAAAFPGSDKNAMNVAVSKTLLDVKNGLVSVNGTKIPLGKLSTPDEARREAYGESIRGILDARVKAAKKTDPTLSLDAESLSVRQLANGNYEIINTDTGYRALLGLADWGLADRQTSDKGGALSPIIMLGEIIEGANTVQANPKTLADGSDDFLAKELAKAEADLKAASGKSEGWDVLTPIDMLISKIGGTDIRMFEPTAAQKAQGRIDSIKAAQLVKKTKAGK